MDWEKDITQVASLTGFNSPSISAGFIKAYGNDAGAVPEYEKGKTELTEET